MTMKVTYASTDANDPALNDAFDSAILTARQQIGRTLTEADPSVDRGAKSEILVDSNPAHLGEVLAKFHLTTDLDSLLARSHAAFRFWGRLPYQERIGAVLHVAQRIVESKMELAAVVALETGKNRLESLGDVEEAADLLRYYAQQVVEAEGYIRPLGRLAANEQTRDVLRPYGVFAVLSPFNFPFALATGMSGAALLAGNTVVLKPSEETPWCAWLLGQLFAEAFTQLKLPEEIFQVVFGFGPSLGEALVQHRGVDGIAFTGSAKVGRRIVEGTFGKPHLMELGGKNAAIVTESAELEAATSGCFRSAFGLSGQKCSALSRLYVHQQHFGTLSQALCDRAAAAKLGPPERHDSFMGPLINQEAVQRFERVLALVRRDGEILAGGKTRPDLGGYYVEPTLIRLPRGHALWRQELFLPVLALEPYESFDEALSLANDCDYGLTAGIFTRDKNELNRFMNEVEAGVLYANRQSGATTGAWPGVQSFCGWKASGVTGKGGCGPYYVAQFMREQSQTVME